MKIETIKKKYKWSVQQEFEGDWIDSTQNFIPFIGLRIRVRAGYKKINDITWNEDDKTFDIECDYNS